MNESNKVSNAHSNLIALRDEVCFARLKEAYSIVPHDGMKPSNLMSLASALASQGRTTEQVDLIVSKIKRVHSTVGNVEVDEEAFIHAIASKLACDPSIRESAAILSELLR